MTGKVIAKLERYLFFRNDEGGDTFAHHSAFGAREFEHILLGNRFEYGIEVQGDTGKRRAVNPRRLEATS